MTTRTSSLPPEELARTLAAAERFFGVMPPGLHVQPGSLSFTEPSPHDALFARAVECPSPTEVQQLVRGAFVGGGAEGAAALECLLAYRSLEVPDLLPYLEAARRSPALPLLAARARDGRPPATPDDALAIAAGLDDGAALGDPTRLGLPHEVLARGACSPMERALLVHVLLERVGAAPVRTVVSGDDAITRAGTLAVRASDHSLVDPGAVSSDGPAFAHAAA